MTTFVGIDNGLSGAMVVLENNKVVAKHLMPVIKGEKKREYDVVALNALLTSMKRDYPDLLVAVEKNAIIPISGRLSVASTSYGQGLLVGLLTAHEIRYIIVRSQEWIKEVLVGVNEPESGKASVLFCQRLFPSEDWRATERSKKEHSGFTDAALIALYAARKFG